MSIRRNILTASATALVLLAGFGKAIPAANAQHGPKSQQPPAKIIVDPPIPEPLQRGVAIVQFRTENVQIVPVFGPTAAKVAPRIGHLHVTLDDAPWHWGHTSNDPIIVAPLPPGPHKILIELADADHNVLATEVVKFEVSRPMRDDVCAPEKQKAKSYARNSVIAGNEHLKVARELLDKLKK